MILLWYYSTREYKSDDCKSSFLSVQYLFFPIHYLFYFDYWQYSILTLNGFILTCCLRFFSLDFDLVRLDFLPDFPRLFFLLQYLSTFWESTLAGVPVYIQESTLDAQRSQNHHQNIAQFPLVRDCCAKRLQYWDQQYYCNHAHLFPCIF